MIFAFMNIGAPEVILILIALFLIVAVGNYGRHTIFGYWGSILLALFTTPVVAFILIAFLKMRKAV